MINKKKILAIDDEEDFLRLLRMNLEQSGEYIVETESQATQSLEHARKFRPDLILLDFIMPDKLGPYVAMEIQADPDLKNIPIVFLTSSIRIEKVACVGGIVGGYPYFDKPVDTDDLIECLEGLLL